MTSDMLLLSGVGIVAGMLGGLLGIGGNVITLPAMVLLLGRHESPGYQHVYQAAAMVVMIFVTAPSTWKHYKQKAIILPIVKWIAPAALVGILLGVATSNVKFFAGDGAIYLRGLLGLFLFYVLAYNLARMFANRRLPALTDDDIRSIGPLRPTLLIGGPMGFFGGLLGIGGGSFCIPLQQLFLRIPFPRAIANSSFVLFCVGTFGALYKLLSLPGGGEKLYALKLAAILTPTCFLGAWIGVRLMYLLPRNVVRTAFCVLMLYAGSKLLLGAIGKLV